MEIDSTWDFTPHTWRRPWRRSWRERTRAGRGRRRRRTCWTTRLSPGRKHYSIIKSTLDKGSKENFYTDTPYQTIWDSFYGWGWHNKFTLSRVEESSDDQAFGSPHSSKIIRSYTQGDLLCPVPCFQDTRRARPPGLKTIISSDVMFLFTRLGWARTGMGDCRQKIMFIWFDCNKISRRKHNIHCSLQHQREDAQFVKIIFNFHNMKFSCMMPNAKLSQ